MSDDITTIRSKILCFLIERPGEEYIDKLLSVGFSSTYLKHFDQYGKKFVHTPQSKLFDLSVAFYNQNGKKVTIDILFNEVNKKLEGKAEIAAYLSVLDYVRETETPVNEFEYLISYLKDYTLKWRTTVILSGAASLLQEEDPEEALQSLQRDITRISDDYYRSSGGAIDVSEAMKGWRESYAERKEDPSKIYGFQTGFRTFDEVSFGIFPGQMLVIAGRPEHGKSLVMMHLLNKAYEEGKTVLYVSKDMTVLGQLNRLITMKTQYASDMLRRSALSEEEEEVCWEKLNQFEVNPNKFFILGADRCNNNGDIEREIKDIISRGQGLDLVAVDYAQQMYPAFTPRGSSDWERIGLAVEELHTMAIRYNLPMLVASQVPRAGVDHADGGTEFLSRSDIIGQTADTVWRLQKISDTSISVYVSKGRDHRSQFNFFLTVDYNRMLIVESTKVSGDSGIVKDVDVNELLGGILDKEEGQDD